MDAADKIARLSTDQVATGDVLSGKFELSTWPMLGSTKCKGPVLQVLSLPYVKTLLPQRSKTTPDS